MIILSIGKYLLGCPKRAKRIEHSAGALLFGALVYLLWNVRLEEIKCFSGQFIKAGEYTPRQIDADVEPVLVQRSTEHGAHNTILLTGDASCAQLVSQIHKNALGMKNCTKGYSVHIPSPGALEKAQHFLVIKVKRGESSRVLFTNKGWQVNSDILAMFMSKMEFFSRTSALSFLFPNKVFNEITIETNEEEVGKVLDVLWNINNLYSHSLGVYFYWVVGDKAVFLSSNVLLVILLGVTLVFLEVHSRGTFQNRLFSSKAHVFSLSVVCPGSAFFFFWGLTFFEQFILYWIVLLLVFPVALLLAGGSIALFACTLIGRQVKEKMERYMWARASPRVQNQ
ncbi:hypothetical protein NECID01_1782 [Nematocida sp. AWRm77]|nr:hypothetical protein NECID01_1782 [Nematocida sp. AWRm77]